MNIYVGNLDFRVDENDLKGIFEDYGTVTDAKVITDKYTGKSKGFGFVVIEDNATANKAISELNGTTLESRAVGCKRGTSKKTILKWQKVK